MNEPEQQTENTVTPVVPEVTEMEAVAETVTEVKEEVTTAAAVGNEDIKAVATETSATTVAVASAASILNKAKDFLKAKKYLVATLALVLLALVALVYVLEDKGKLNTGIFDEVQKQVSKYTAAAKVNNEKISEYDLEISMTQLSSGAAAQGADVTDPTVQTEIKNQALDMLVNTELLKQEAATRGIVVTEEEINTRLETLKTDVGGEDVLSQRMEEFGINQKTLLRDIKNELTIQKLLDEVFKEKSVVVTEEDIAAFYEEAGGTKAGLPALEEVKTQIEAQLKATKEQSVVTAYIEELRGKAQIETLI